MDHVPHEAAKALEHRGGELSDSDSNDDDGAVYSQAESASTSESSIPLNKINSSGVDEDGDDDSVQLNVLDNDEAPVALLKQIFPNESANSLRQLHIDHCQHTTKHDGEQTRSNINNGQSSDGNTAAKTTSKQLPEDFLRLPPHVAVRRYMGGRWQYRLVDELEKRAIAQHERCHGTLLIVQGYAYSTQVVQRDDSGGLGLTLSEYNGFVSVCALRNSAGSVFVGDILIGIEGVAFCESVNQNENVVQHAVSRIRSGSDPVVMHIQRLDVEQRLLTPPRRIVTTSLLDTSDVVTNESAADISFQSDVSAWLPGFPQTTNACTIHPFVELLARSRLLLSLEDQIAASQRMQSFSVRTRQWEDIVAFHVPSTNNLIPLGGVRKALSLRIVNTFEDGKDTAYTLWVYDVQSGQEWYAPVRYLKDFDDLRRATMEIWKPVGQITYPRSARSSLASLLSPSKETTLQKETKCRQLERFLRSLCSMIYTEHLHPFMAEVAIHVQSFLGCDDIDFDKDSGVPSVIGGAAPFKPRVDAAHQERIRVRLKRSIQRYTYQLFLLDAMSRTVTNFVDSVRTRGPRLQDIETLEAKGREILKSHAMQDLGQIQAFLDYVQDLILEGCTSDFQSIAESADFQDIHELITSKNGGEGYWDRIVREAVREQVEIEVYVPLRSIASRWLVKGWRHDDMEVHFKIKELRKRPQEFFRIAKNGQRNDWSSVSKILHEGVGLSTLPCVKLRAIIAAAREIFRIYQTQESGNLGADDLLPIFIYVVLQADLERPCALCVLLRTLCDKINKIGEIGYYLLTFEAAITHCQEVDLTADNQEEMGSFLSIPLNDD